MTAFWMTWLIFMLVIIYCSREFRSPKLKRHFRNAQFFGAGVGIIAWIAWITNS